jgi:hypothetical protein
MRLYPTVKSRAGLQKAGFLFALFLEPARLIRMQLEHFTPHFSGKKSMHPTGATQSQEIF